MNNKAQMITIFFSLFLILAIITILGIESANLNTNENVNSLIQAYNLPKLEYYNFLNIISKISTINPSEVTNVVFNSTIKGIYSNFFQNLNVTEEGLNTSNLVISNFAESIPLLITNYQNIATPNPFQQMINISISSIDNYINTTYFGQNVEFVYDNNSVIPSWLEYYNSKYAIWWVKIPSIPAKGSITIYMKFANKKTNLFNNKNDGEAPQLSCPNPANTAGCSTYAEYDDGASVFNFYDNFAGTSLNTNKWLSYSSGFSATIDNGFTISLSAGQISSGNAAYVITSKTAFSPNIIAEACAQGSSAVTNTRSYMPGLTTTTSTTEGVNILDQTSYSNMAFSNGRNNVITYVDFQGDSSAQYYNDVANPSGYNIIGLAYTGSTNTWYMNYRTVASSSTDSPSGNVYFALGMGVYVVNPDAVSMSVQWVRVRAYPPNGVMPSVQILNVPPEIGYIAPLTITNHQDVATSAPFQQEVVMNASRYSAIEAPNLSNIEFFYSNGTIIPSWLESGNSSSKNAIYWLKIGSIPANSSINLFIGFASTNLNLFNGKTVGEAPQLSSTYGEYDDGANVFPVYYNFAGTSLPSDFTSYLGDATLSIDNGLHIKVVNNGCSSTWAGIIYNNPINAADSIVETYSSGTRAGGPEDVGLYTGNSEVSGGYAGVASTWGWGYGTISGGYGNIGNPFDISSGSGIASIYWIGNGDEGVGWNYDFVSSTNTNEGWSSSLYASIQTGQCSPGANMMYYWFRVRSYPPNGVMPSTSIGAI